MAQKHSQESSLKNKVDAVETVEKELDLSQELDEFNRMYTDASKGRRFGNYIIDLVMRRIATAIFGIGLGFIFALLDSDGMFFLNSSALGLLVNYLIGYTIMVIYYGFTEIAFKGKSIGKMITKTKVVDINGGPASQNQIVKRSLSRMIPFYPFSVLFADDDGRGWHDQISRTRVVMDL